MLRRDVVYLYLLDSNPDNIWSKLLWILMRGLGFRIKEVEFFAGHLKTRDGEAIWTAARKVATEIAFHATSRIRAKSKSFSTFNQAWGRNTLLKFIARSLELNAFQLALRCMVAEIMGKAAGRTETVLIVSRRMKFDSDLVKKFISDLKVIYYSSWSIDLIKQTRGSVLILMIYEKMRNLIWTLGVFLRGVTKAQNEFEKSDSELPLLLVLQEDDLSLDRSYRTQPHWLFQEYGRPPFRTAAIQLNSVDRLNPDTSDLRDYGIDILSWKDIYLISRNSCLSHPIVKQLNWEKWKCAFKSFFGSSTEVSIMLVLARLFSFAYTLAKFCAKNQVKAFMTCDNYMFHADAMLLIAPFLDITTLSYQYSNMGVVPFNQMTTADMMLTFSPIYHKRWTRDGIAPGMFVNTGYVYDSSFEYVRSRASNYRRRLEDSGARFVICYFDENVQNDKYGCVSEEDHCREILSLFNLILDDPTVGLVVKTQFERNSPTNLDGIASVRATAEATGRYLELVYGTNRNIVFPAEAALVADMVIGHTVGATAALEAALTGVRCILLNPYGVKGHNDILYAQADIVYPSIADALDAIQSFKSGMLEHARLGDWSPIIDKFDSFRDGRAGHRMRNLLEEVVLRNSS